MSEAKRCAHCGEIKPLDEFVRNRRNKDGRGSYCYPCHRAKGRAHIERKGGTRGYHLAARYGITEEHFDRMAERQGGLCAVCRERPGTHVDHDHETAQVRGLLCYPCNAAVGNLSDLPGRAERIARYLRFELPEQVAPPVRPEDIEVEKFAQPEKGAFQFRGARVTHKPTGMTVVVGHNRSYVANLQEAIEDLRKALGMGEAA
jgi:hypothetical protein